MPGPGVLGQRLEPGITAENPTPRGLADDKSQRSDERFDIPRWTQHGQPTLVRGRFIIRKRPGVNPRREDRADLFEV